jgi:predicted metal-dependent phosphotriesterase family hydrolase|tara:strand:+ start:243 stop:665 length:423 start_codon:yes stop_codon:yes gene_type:complete
VKEIEMSGAGSVSLEKLTKVYLKISNKRSQLKKEFDKEEELLVARQDKIKQALLEHCKEHDVSSVKTSEGLFYRSVRQKYWTSDWESMYEFVLENEIPEFFDKRLNQKNIKQFLEENPDKMPKGLNSDSTYTISVRRPSK